MTTLYKLEEYKSNIFKLAIIGKKIFENSSSFFGKEYLTRICCELGTSLSAHTVYIIELNRKNAEIFNSVVNYSNGELNKNEAFNTDINFWNEIKRREYSCNINNLTELFPDDKYIHQHQLKSLISIPFYNSNKTIIGFVTCFFDKRLETINFVKDVIQLFVPRIGTEIERLYTEFKLKRSENRFRQISDSTTSWIWEVDLNGKYIYTSNKITDILGYQPEELIDKKYFYDLYSKDFHATGKNKILSHFRQEKSIKNYEHYKIHKNGSKVWLLTFGLPVYNQEGKISSYRGTSIDITQQKVNELKIQKQHQFLISVLNSLNHPFRVIDVKNHKISLFNESSMNLKADYDIYNQIEYPYLDLSDKSPFQVVLESGESAMQELIVRNKKGQEYPAEVHCHPVFDEDGILNQIIEYTIDITDRKKTEWVLQQRVNELECMHKVSSILEKEPQTDTENLESIAHIIPMGFHLKQKSGCNIKIGTNEVKTANFTRNSHILQSPINNNQKQIGIIEVCCNTSSPHNPFLKEEKEMLDTIAQQLGSYFVRKQDEKVRQIIYAISEAVNTTNNIKELIKFIHSQINQLVNANNFFIGFYNHDKDLFTIPYLHDEKIDIREFKGGKSLSKYLIDQKRSMIITEEKLNEMEASGIIVSVGMAAKNWLGVPLIVKNEVFGILAVQSYVNTNAYDQNDQQILEFVSNQIGASLHRKKIEDDLKVALEKSRESDRLKSAFLSSISHELRTPLNAIIGFSELIDNNLSHDETVEFASMINKSGRNLLHIVDNILSITKLEAKHSEIVYSTIDIKYLCENAIMQYSDNLQQKNIKLRLRPCGKELPHTMRSDQTKIFHIISNLLDNAIKFSLKEDIELGYNCCYINKRQFIRFFVRDKGIGISKEKLNVVFDIFRQADDSQTRKFDGVGIGLALVYKYTKLLDGKINVHSEEGKGSVFTVLIPRN
jgi:PAS domain S-box-containing protein